MKLKALVLASAIAFSGAAQADIAGPHSGTSASLNGDLVLFIYDTVNSLSYVQDLVGNQFTDILSQTSTGSFSGSFNLDASKLSIFAASDLTKLTWGLVSASYDDANLNQSGFLSTVAPGSNPTAFLPDDSQLNVLSVKFSNLANTYNATAGHAGNVLSSGTGTGLTNNVKADANHFTSSTDFANTSKPSVAQELWLFSEDVDGNTITPVKASANAWVLDLSNLSSATLKSAPAVTANTPLPAAAWLMFSALMGLGGIARRRNNV